MVPGMEQLQDHRLVAGGVGSSRPDEQDVQQQGTDYAPTTQDLVDLLEDWKRSILPLLDDKDKQTLVARQSEKLRRSIQARLIALARAGELDEALRLLDRVHDDLHASLLEARMYHPLLSDAVKVDQNNNYDSNRVSRICHRMLKHNVSMDLATLKLVCRAWQKSSSTRRLLPMIDAHEQRMGRPFTSAMYMVVIRTVWPAQAKRYLDEKIVPTNNPALVRQAVEIILWKYRVIVTKLLDENRNELLRTVRIAHNFYDRIADRQKGNATFLMMDMFCMAELPESVVRLANTQSHPWSAAMFGLLMEAHRGDQTHALHWFKQMVKSCPNSGGFSVMLNILAKPPNAAMIEQVHATLLALHGTVQPDGMTIQALITCYGALRRRDQVLQIVRTYHRQQNNHIDATATKNDTYADRENEAPPIMDAGNYHKALQYCGDDAAAMNEIVDLMMATPSIVESMDDRRWRGVLDTIAGLATEAAAIRVQELVERRFPNNVIYWTTVVKAWGEANVAGSSGDRIWSIYQKLVTGGNVLLDGPFCTAVLFHLCKSHNDVDFERANRILEAIERQQDGGRMPAPDADQYETILHAFLARSQLHKAKKQIDRRIELALSGKNRAAEPVRGSYQQFIGAWVRNGKDLRLLTKILDEWAKIYKQRNQHNGPDLVAYEMLFVAWDRDVHHPGRTLYKSNVEEIIRNIVRLGDRTLGTSRRVVPPPVKLRR